MTLPETLTAAEANLAPLGVRPTTENPAELVTDKRYHSREGLKEIDGSA